MLIYCVTMQNYLLSPGLPLYEEAICIFLPIPVYWIPMVTYFFHFIGLRIVRITTYSLPRTFQFLPTDGIFIYIITLLGRRGCRLSTAGNIASFFWTTEFLVFHDYDDWTSWTYSIFKSTYRTLRMNKTWSPIQFNFYCSQNYFN